jgi:homoserine dehydrogenase
VVLTKLAFGAELKLSDVYYDGIEELHSDDLEYAREFNLCLKLLGTAERNEAGVSVAVHPTLLPRDHPLSLVSGGINAVTIEGDAFEMVTISGPGAGGPPTASAVLGDLLSVMRGDPITLLPSSNLSSVGDERFAFYVHFEVVDHPGVLASISGALGNAGISVQSVLQRGLGDTARLILVLHPCSRRKLLDALTQVSESAVLRSQPRVIHVLGNA